MIFFYGLIKRRALPVLIFNIRTIFYIKRNCKNLIILKKLNLHYFSRHVDAIRMKYGDQFVRIWNIYLRGCAAAFRVSGIDVHQLLFSKGLNNGLPLNYAYLYK